jgi:hypothetical protein
MQHLARREPYGPPAAEPRLLQRAAPPICAHQLLRRCNHAACRLERHTAQHPRHIAAEGWDLLRAYYGWHPQYCRSIGDAWQPPQLSQRPCSSDARDHRAAPGPLVQTSAADRAATETFMHTCRTVHRPPIIALPVCCCLLLGRSGQRDGCGTPGAMISKHNTTGLSQALLGPGPADGCWTRAAVWSRLFTGGPYG